MGEKIPQGPLKEKASPPRRSRRRRGGRSEVKRSRAGSPHGEPRTEPRPLRRRSLRGSSGCAPVLASRCRGTPAVGRTGGTAPYGIALWIRYRINDGEHLV